MFIFRLKRFGIPCPHVQVLKKHVLVMSFIGKDTQSAPKLKEVKLSTEDMQDAFEQTIDVRFIYRKYLLIMCQNNHTQKIFNLCVQMETKEALKKIDQQIKIKFVL